MRSCLRLKGSLGLAVSMLLILALVAAGCGRSAAAGAPRVGTLAPDFTLPALEGDTVTLSQLRGKLVFLNFWATWCPSCRAELPYIQELFAEQDQHGVAVLTVDLSEAQATVKSFMERGGYTFPVGLDYDGRIGNLYNVSAIPATYLIDSNGVVRRVQIGAYRNKDSILAQLRAIK